MGDKRTGQVFRHWAECEENPSYHTPGWYWLRTDGLRFGVRRAGRYYREDAEPQAVASTTPDGGPASFDGAFAYDWVGAARERGKMEDLLDHVRVMRDGKVLAIITAIPGGGLLHLWEHTDAVYDYVDQRWPLTT